MSEIFKSMLTQKFKSQKIENAYEEMKSQGMRKCNIIYSIINLFSLLVNILIYCLTFLELEDKLFSYIKITSFLLIGLQTVCLFLSIVLKGYRIHKWIASMNISIILASNQTFRIYLAIFTKLDYALFSLAYIIQQVHTMIWYFTNSLEFIDGFFTYIASFIIVYAYYAAYIPINVQYRFLVNAVIMMLSIFLSYFYMHEKKKSFYYIFMNETSAKSYRSIIENMNSGFMSILNDKIVNVNHILHSHLMKIDKSKEENKDEININISNKIHTLNDPLHTKADNNKTSLENLKYEETKALLNSLFKNLLFESSISRIDGKTEYEMTKEFLKNYLYNEAIQSESFVFLGTKEFKYESGEASYYEIFGRYSHIFRADKEEKFEFLFNDVSKTKISESINANIKYKSIFLSKIL